MIDSMQKIFLELEDSRSRFLESLAALDEAQLAFRPRSKSWSALEVAEHVLLSEQLATDAMLRLAGRPSRPRTVLQRLAYGVVWAALKLGLRTKAPSRIVHPTGGMTLREIRGEWDATRRRLRDHVDGLGEDAPQQAGFGHPLAGPLTLREGLLFLLRHIRHHERQLERLQRHSRFPRAQPSLSARAG